VKNEETSMKNEVHKIDDFFKQHSGKYYCNKCLGIILRVKLVNVKQITRGFQETALSRDYDKVDTNCAHCGKNRTCRAYIGLARSTTAA
jgi:hypothetical protein